MTNEEIKKGDTVILLVEEKDCTKRCRYRVNEVNESQDYIEFWDDYGDLHQLPINNFGKVNL